jgi:Phytanoyl-CoA dioxygenase (PhyH)
MNIISHHFIISYSVLTFASVLASVQHRDRSKQALRTGSKRIDQARSMRQAAVLLGWFVCGGGGRGSFIGPTTAFFVLPQSKLTRTTTNRHLLLSSTPRTHGGAYGGLYEVQEEMLVRQGILEEEWMKDADRSILLQPSSSEFESSPSSSLSTNRKKTKTKGGGEKSTAGKGFGAGSSSNNSSTKQQQQQLDQQRFQQAAQRHATTLRDEGVVRIDQVLSNDVADRLRQYVLALKDDPDRSFLAEVLLRKNRCDIKLPLTDDDTASSPVMEALQDVLLESPVRSTIETALGAENTGSVLHELSCLISSPGSQRQVVHPDTPMLLMKDHPSVLTCFIALQDITVDMGPTVFLPRTHTTGSHDQFKHDKETLLRTTPHVMAVLPKGSCAIFDSRLLHCGSANRSSETGANANAHHRAIFYFSIRHSNITNPGNPASLRDDLKSLPLSTLVETVLAGVMIHKNRKGTRHD